MGIIIDLIIIGFVLLSVFLGYKKGLLELGIKLCAFIIAIVVTFILYRPISNLVINNTSIDENLQTTIENNINEFMNSEESKDTSNALVESAKNGILSETSRTLAINIINIVILIALFVVIRIALIFVTGLANLIAKLPILKQFNKLGGVIYGLLRGILIVYIALFIINIYGQINPTNEVTKKVDTSYICKLMYNNNILNIFFIKN